MDRKERKETELIRHSNMMDLEIFVVEMGSREPHGHDDMEIGLILDGKVNLFLDGKMLPLQAGDIYVMNRYQIHSFSSRYGDNHILAFQIRTELYRKLNRGLSRIQFHENVLREGERYHQLHSLLLQCADVYFSQEPYKELKCASLIMDILYRMIEGGDYTEPSEKEYRTAQSNARRVTRITDYIAEHYMEHLSLDELAEKESVSPYYLSHFIRASLGLSFQEYVASVRFEHALHLVRDTSLNLLDICMETGFSSTRYLNQAFIKNFGRGAKEYRALEEKPTGSIAAALPAENIQRRYPYEQSAHYLKAWNKII